MGDEQNQNEVRTPADEEEDMAGAETDEETNPAVAQARLIAGID